MKIEVTHVIKADPQVISLVSAFLGALGAPSQDIKIADAVELTKTTTPTADTKKETSTKATKRTYLFHEESGTVLEVNKGEELAKHLEQGLVEISKAEYDRIQAEKQVRIDKAKEQTEIKSVVDEAQEDAENKGVKDHGITIEMVRAEATKLTAKGRQADFKAILTSFDAEKLSSVPEEKYPELLAAIKEAVGEE
ncbi:hypothetical protein [Lysinibacillus sp. NPDC093688]|uniref:hypothetical protein n=1 Tax=Lysinibacillus sp. NPDC093688 TaxID=3390577 RepID=UPI003D062F46